MVTFWVGTAYPGFLLGFVVIVVLFLLLLLFFGGVRYKTKYITSGVILRRPNAAAYMAGYLG